jgi:type III pantothenate kinase
VDGLVTRLRAALVPEDPESVAVIATGGLAPLAIPYCATVSRYEPELTLIGLRLVFERNR